MPNRSCDFCLNDYRKEPSVGYFKFTSFMKIKLDMLDVEADFICGLHFDQDSFLESGRLRPNAVPTFFPSRENLLHDHPYYSATDGPKHDLENHEDGQDDSEVLPRSQSGSINIEDDVIYEDDDNEAKDPNYSPDSGDLINSHSPLLDSDSSVQQSSLSSMFSQDEQDPIKTPKVIVWVILLLDLFTVCRQPKCGEYVDKANIRTSYKGAVITIAATCNASHTTQWSSSPLVGMGKFAMPVLNILITTYTFTTGLHIDQVKTFFQHIHCACPGLTTMYKLCSSLVNKVVYNYWLRMQALLISERRVGAQPLHLGGDGSYDSPGFSARYCNYIVMDLTTKHILTFFTAIKFQVSGGSSAMEPYAAKTCLLSLLSYAVKIASFTTDRSSTIGTMMKSDPRLELIVHEYDVWHFIKSVMKDIWKFCKAKKCSKLALWKDSIANNLWYSFATSRQVGMLREKIMSITHHCSNSHQFPNNKYHLACSHGELPEEGRSKPWLAVGSPELDKLTMALTGKDNNRFDDLSMMTGFHHTGDLENFNSLGNKYRAKGYVFGYDGMVARTALACIDHNSNVGREQALTKDGTPRTRTECDRSGSKWHARVVKTAKNYDFRDLIAKEVLECVETRTCPVVELPTGGDIPKNQSKVTQPSKPELLEKHQTRLNFKYVE